MPRAPDGAIIKTAWFQSYLPGEEPSRFDRIVQSWDTANKSSELSDFSVCTTWGHKGQNLFLLHVLRKRMDYPELKRTVCEHAQRFRPSNILIEDKASGIQLIQELIHAGVHGVTRYEPVPDKVMRLSAASITIENGFVYLPKEADWLGIYLQELTTFPNSKHDDQADSTSQALDWLKQQNYHHGLFDYYKQEALRRKLGLSFDYRFVQCEDEENVIAIHETTGHTITWRNGERVVAHTVVEVEEEVCPVCQASCVGTMGDRKRCNQCGHSWPAVSLQER